MTNLFYQRIHANSPKLIRESLGKLFEIGFPACISIKSIDDLSISIINVNTKFLDIHSELPYIDCISYFSLNHFFTYIEYRIKKSEIDMDEYTIKDGKVHVYYIGAEKNEISFHKEGILTCSIIFR